MEPFSAIQIAELEARVSAYNRRTEFWLRARLVLLFVVAMLCTGIVIACEDPPRELEAPPVEILVVYLFIVAALGLLLAKLVRWPGRR